METLTLQGRKIVLTLNADNKELPLLRTAKVCRLLSVLCRAAFFILILWSSFAISIMCYAIFATSIPDNSVLLSIAILILYALFSASSCLIPFILSRMLRDISIDGKAFTLKNSRRLMLLAFMQIIYAILEPILLSTNQQFFSHIGDSTIEVGKFAGEFMANTDTSLNLYPLLMFAVFFALSYVFKYGVLLQQESDETL